MKTHLVRPIAGLVMCLAIGVGTQAQAKSITAGEAKNQVGETATVCGRVASTRYAVTSKGEPTFLDLDAAYPHQVFTIVIWGSDRAKFGQPNAKYANAKLCVTGAVESYRGIPEIIANNPSQIVSGADGNSTAQSSANSPPAGATAQCRDGSYSFSQHRQGTCSHHSGVAKWL